MDSLPSWVSWIMTIAVVISPGIAFLAVRRRGPHNRKPIDRHYAAIQTAMRGVFHELGLAA
jgi:hypothetical protein